jgi:type I restriction enzyme, S subunit
MKARKQVECVSLGDLLFGIETGKSIRTTERTARDCELGVLKVSAVSWGAFRPKEAKAVHADYTPEDHHRVRAGDVLISRANTAELVGAVVRVDRDYPNRLLSDKTLRLVLDTNRCDPNYLVRALRLPHARSHLEENATGTSDSMKNISQDDIRATPIPLPSMSDQGRISEILDKLFAPIEAARQSLTKQLQDIEALLGLIVAGSMRRGRVSEVSLREVLSEVACGIGGTWKAYKVFGATRSGIAPARERPGKYAERYKPIAPNTIFYNPMRILIGSIAFVDEDDEPGITSPDYVVLKGKSGLVDSRWFYYWLRSPLGERCIQSLARGAVRERMLFNRLAEGKIELPAYSVQVKASKALAQIKPMRAAIQKQIQELELMPQKLLAQVFES